MRMNGHRYNLILSSMQILQGSIFMADLNPVLGHEQGGYRPVLIMQNSILNKNLNTVIIAPITKNLKAKGFFTTHYLPGKDAGLDFDSVVLLYQLRTIDKSRLKKKVGDLNSVHFRAMMEQLSLVF